MDIGALREGVLYVIESAGDVVQAVYSGRRGPDLVFISDPDHGFAPLRLSESDLECVRPCGRLGHEKTDAV